MCCTLADTIIHRYKKLGDIMLLLLYFYMLTFIDVFMVSAMMFTTNYLRYHFVFKVCGTTFCKVQDKVVSFAIIRILRDPCLL